MGGSGVVMMKGIATAEAKVGMVLRRQQPTGQVVAAIVLGAEPLRQQQVLLLRPHFMVQPLSAAVNAGAKDSANRSASSKLPSARLYVILYMPGFIGKWNYAKGYGRDGVADWRSGVEWGLSGGWSALGHGVADGRMGVVFRVGEELAGGAQCGRAGQEGGRGDGAR